MRNISREQLLKVLPLLQNTVNESKKSTLLSDIDKGILNNISELLIFLEKEEYSSFDKGASFVGVIDNRLVDNETAFENTKYIVQQIEERVEQKISEKLKYEIYTVIMDIWVSSNYSFHEIATDMESNIMTNDIDYLLSKDYDKANYKFINSEYKKLVNKKKD